MKQLILNIDENKFKDFVSYLKTLNYVTINEEDEILLLQETEVLDRLLKIETGTMKTRPWSEAKEDIFKNK
jgi:hypothetical protein